MNNDWLRMWLRAFAVELGKEYSDDNFPAGSTLSDDHVERIIDRMFREASTADSKVA